MRLMERTIESKEKTIEIMNDTSRKDYKKRLRLDEDIKKLKRIIIMKDKTIETKNVTKNFTLDMPLFLNHYSF